ncbi:invasion associated locus B family protein [Chelativorans xinjiangense]|uniref:invasion associated locus B family protein n=1 Tax=Chelativorans xinjiangense TaxID=2681485 RepID=UPI00135B4345|nr:invasion associated locus B family protein [Chelativorans xinjiangense]
MMSLKARASCLAAAFSGTLGLAAVGYGSAAFAQQEPPQGWFKACTKQEEVDVCNVQFMLRANSGQLLTSVNLIEVTGKVNRRVLQIAVPTGRLVPPGVGLQIDAGNTQKVDYAICVPDRCVAEAQLTDEMVNSFKRGSELTLTSVNFQNQPNPVKVTLQGFTGAYDGEPLEQSDLDERQKKLEEFVSKNNEEFAERLKKAQENAKQQSQ